MRQSGACARRAQGFTLIELLFAIVILAVLLSLGAPMLRNLVLEQRVKAAASDVHGSLIFARSEAIKRNANINIVIASGSNWAAGWSVQEPNVSPACPSPPCTLKTQDALEGISITGPVSPVTFQGDGRVAGTAAVMAACKASSGITCFALKASDSDTAATITARCVLVDLSSRANVMADEENPKNADNGCQKSS